MNFELAAVGDSCTMECELVRLASVPVGLVTSALFYASEQDSQQAEVSQLTAACGTEFQIVP